MFALDEEAAEFADRLTRLLNGTITTGSVLEVTMRDENLALITTPGGIKRSVLPLSLDADPTVRAQALLWLRIEFRVAPDDERQHLRVNRSVVGLCVNPQTGHCAMRVEYDRDYETAPAAHVGWQDVLSQSRGEWLHRQTRAATRRHPEAAAEQLRTMGYRIEDPD